MTPVTLQTVRDLAQYHPYLLLVQDDLVLRPARRQLLLSMQTCSVDLLPKMVSTTRMICLALAADPSRFLE